MGAARLLPEAEYDDALERHVTPEARERLIGWLHREGMTSTSFHDNCSLLYHQPWGEALKAELINRASVVEFGKGEGYLLDDSKWLHGREYIRKDLATYQRLYRLAYDTRVSRAHRPDMPGITPRTEWEKEKVV
jgi:hypothetical protein